MPARPESDGGLSYLEQKLGIFVQGPSPTRRNPALDILTGRVADQPPLSGEAASPQSAAPDTRHGSPAAPAAPRPPGPTPLAAAAPAAPRPQGPTPQSAIAPAAPRPQGPTPQSAIAPAAPRPPGPTPLAAAPAAPRPPGPTPLAAAAPRPPGPTPQSAGSPDGSPPLRPVAPAAASAPSQTIPSAHTRSHPGVTYRPARGFWNAASPAPAVDWTARLPASPWLAASDDQRPRLRIERPTPAPPTRRHRVPYALLVATSASLLLAAGLVVHTILQHQDAAEPEHILVATGQPLTIAPATAQADPPAPITPVPAAASAAAASGPSAEPVAPASTGPAAPAAAASGPSAEPVVPVAAPESATRPVAAAPLAAPRESAPAVPPAVVLDERFTSPPPTWPNDSQSVAWQADGAYHLATRHPSQFVALAVPGTTRTLADTVVAGSFRKTGGMAGGGYGLILRDQDPQARDGLNQSGHYYVFEAGDRGEIGIWLRDGDRWVDVVTWTPSSAVKPGLASNELTVTAVGDRLTFAVNGVTVATQTDTVLHTGAAGVFVGGDTNEVALDRLTISTPADGGRSLVSPPLDTPTNPR